MNFWEQAHSRNRWRSLLDSPDKANRKVALALAQAHQLPEALRDEILIEKLTHPERKQVLTGMELAKAAGDNLVMEALYFRFFVIGTVGASYGWIKPFLSEKQQFQAGNVFKSLGYGMESETGLKLSKLSELDTLVSPERIAFWLCASTGIRGGIRHLAFQYLIENNKEEWIRKALSFFAEEDELHLAFLQELPAAIFEMKNLQVINCRGGSRQLTSIPIELMQLDKLKALILPINDISIIPPAIFNHPSLKILDLSYNPLTSVPEHLAETSRLEKLIVTRPMLDVNVRQQLDRLAKAYPDLVIENHAA